jgi:hypothetical protein
MAITDVEKDQIDVVVKIKPENMKKGRTTKTTVVKLKLVFNVKKCRKY